MKPRLHCISTFNLRLIGAIPVALCLVLYSTIVKAEITNEKLHFPDSHSQPEKSVEAPDFSKDLKNLSPNFSLRTGEALNSSRSLLGKKRLDFALVIPNDVKSQVEDRADRNKVAEKSIDSNSPHLLGSSQQDSPSLQFASTSSASAPEIPDVQLSETNIHPFEPATSVDLPRDSRKIVETGDKNDGRKDTETLFHTSTKEIQPFQPEKPVTSVDLPRGLRKIAAVEDAGTRGK